MGSGEAETALRHGRNRVAVGGILMTTLSSMAMLWTGMKKDAAASSPTSATLTLTAICLSSILAQTGCRIRRPTTHVLSRGLHSRCLPADPD